jgi:hypothetical protein
MGGTDSSDAQNFKQQKIYKIGTLTDCEMESVKVRLHYIKETKKQPQSRHNN